MDIEGGPRKKDGFDKTAAPLVLNVDHLYLYINYGIFMSFKKMY